MCARLCTTTIAHFLRVDNSFSSFYYFFVKCQTVYLILINKLPHVKATPYFWSQVVLIGTLITWASFY